MPHPQRRDHSASLHSPLTCLRAALMSPFCCPLPNPGQARWESSCPRRCLATLQPAHIIPIPAWSWLFFTALLCKPPAPPSSRSSRPSQGFTARLSLSRDGVLTTVGEMEEIGQGMQVWGEPAAGSPKMLPAPTPSPAAGWGVCTQKAELGLQHQLPALGLGFHLS